MKTKAQISCAFTAKLISAFVFITRIKQFLFFLNLKFRTSSHLLRLYISFCVGPAQKPQFVGFLDTAQKTFTHPHLPLIHIFLVPTHPASPTDTHIPGAYSPCIIHIYTYSCCLLTLHQPQIHIILVPTHPASPTDTHIPGAYSPCIAHRYTYSWCLLTLHHPQIHIFLLPTHPASPTDTHIPSAYSPCITH